MNSAFDYFLKREIPTLLLCNPNQIPVGSLKGAYSVKNTLKFNALSELEFDFPQSPDNGKTIFDSYSLIQNKMVVYVKGVGYYIITECPEDTNGKVPVKHVKCQSSESAMLYRRLTGFSGTFNFYDNDNPDSSLLGLVLKYFPNWTVGYVDPSLIGKYRTFTIDNSTLYNFLISKVESAYSCVFTFNTFARTISAYYIPNINENVGAFFSFNNLNEQITLTEYSDELATVLYCFGGDNVDIRSVNPLGTNSIYNFSYYKNTNWMSQSLIDSLTAWENKVSSYQVTYSTYSAELNQYTVDIAALKSDLVDMQTVLQSYQDIHEVRTAQKLNTDEVEQQIQNQSVKISSQNSLIASKQSQIDTVKSEMRKIVNQLHFTSEATLNNFINDLDEVYSEISALSTNWNTVYIASSTAPEMDVEQLDDSSPSIVLNFSNVLDEISALSQLFSTNVITYPLVDGDTDIIKKHISTINFYLNTLFELFSGLIPDTSITNKISSNMVKLESYYDIIDYTSNFTDAEYLELQNYIFENTYTNSNVIVTDIMTVEEAQAQSQSLYDQSVQVLQRVSKPRYEITGDFVNFLYLPEYQNVIDKIDLGKIITVEVSKGVVVEPVILEMEITYDDPTSFQLTLSNRVRLNNSNFQFADMFLNSAEGSASVSGVTGGAGTTVTPSSITKNISSKVTTAQTAETSQDSDILALTNAQISKLGYISFGINPPSTYGNNEGIWMGWNVGAQLSLFSSANNYLQWDGTKLLIKATNFTLDSLGNITANNADLSGKITAAEGSIGGFTIGATSLTAGSGSNFVAMDSGGINPVFYAGSETPLDAPFRVMPDGTLYATGATISGNISITDGSIGGWTLSPTSLYTDQLSLNGVTPAILMGSATDYLVGTGFFLGKNSGSYKMHIGDPTGEYLAWDGSHLQMSGQWIGSTGVNPALQRWQTTIVFSNVDGGSDPSYPNTIEWSSGVITLSDGTVYNINAGNTGVMSAITYIYLDVATSLTDLQVSALYSDAVGDGKILVAAAQNHDAGASVIPFGGQQPIVDGSQLTIQSIVAENIAVTDLSAISANLGKITSGEILAGTGSIEDGTFTGTAMTYPATVVDGEGSFSLFGMKGGIFKFGISSDDGSAIFAGGDGSIDDSGIHLSGLNYFLTHDATNSTYTREGRMTMYLPSGSSIPAWGFDYVGLLKSANKITNGDFSSGVTGWTGLTLNGGGQSGNCGKVANSDLAIVNLGTNTASDIVMSVRKNPVDGYIYACGFFTTIGGVSANRIAKWNGSAWSALGSGFDAEGWDMAFDTSGNVYVVGNFTTAGGSSAKHIAKWNGSAWSTLGTGFNGITLSICIVGADIYVGGSFSTAGGVTANGIAKYSSSTWSSVGYNNTFTNSPIYCLAYDSVAGTIIAGGAFTSLYTSYPSTQVPCYGMADYNISTNTWSMRTDLQNLYVVYNMVQNGTDLYILGGFTGVVKVGNNVSCNGILRYTSGVYYAVAGGINNGGLVRDLTFDSNGNMYIGGDFSSVGSKSISNIAGIINNIPYAMSGGADSTVGALLFDNGKIYVGGNYSSIFGTSSSKICAVTLSSSNNYTINGYCDKISLTPSTIDTLDISLYIKGTVSSSAVVEIVWYDSSDNQLSTTSLGSLDASTVTSWTLLSTSIKGSAISSSVAKLSIKITETHTYLGGDFWIDTVGVYTNESATIRLGFEQFLTLSNSPLQIQDQSGTLGTPPPSGYHSLYPKSDGLYMMDSSGNENLLGGLVYNFVNNSGKSLAKGDVVVVDSSIDNGVKTTTLAGNPSVCGVCTQTVLSGATGKFASAGTVTVNTTGTITRGHWLVTSTSAKLAKDSGFVQRPAAGAIGIALTGGSGGSVTALVSINPYSSTSVLQQLPTTTLYTMPAAASTFSFNHTVDVGTDLLVVRFAVSTGPYVVAMTCNGNSMTKLIDNPSGTTYSGSGIWYIKNPPSGTVTIAGTLSVATQVFSFYATNYIGSNSTTPFRTPTTVIASGSTTVSQSPSSVVGDIVIDIIPTYGADWYPTATGQSQEVGGVLTGTRYLYASKAPGTTGTTTMSWAGITSSRVYGCAVAIAGS